MIIVRIKGGLGNQMFQYAAGRALAAKLGAELLLDTRDVSADAVHPYRLDQFKLRARPANNDELKCWPKWLRYPSHIARHLGIQYRWYTEPTFNFDSNLSTITSPVLLDGYFQSEKYFEPIIGSIKEEFALKSSISNQNLEIAELAQKSNSVTIHVRRGDYINSKVNLIKHGICSKSYYKEAISLIRKNVENPRFFVFSNDFEWAKENLELGNDAVFVHGNEKKPEEDLFLMTQCFHRIIANSTFSWWGAWLGEKNTGLTIAPTPWFDDDSFNANDLIPRRWILVNK